MEKKITFEEGYQRLEQILSKLNNGEVSLEDSLKYYEEADRLITSCNKLLTQAEEKIQMMVKNREGKVEMQPFGDA
ncbi:MAG: exodeoxyribonuclease VII small subunit [Chlamydiia bacterium]|nr:exodeoxyribonuclease VII small subunit [Chlamydiia bacterium]